MGGDLVNATFTSPLKVGTCWTLYLQCSDTPKRKALDGEAPLVIRDGVEVGDLAHGSRAGANRHRACGLGQEVSPERLGR